MLFSKFLIYQSLCALYRYGYVHMHVYVVLSGCIVWHAIPNFPPVTIMAQGCLAQLLWWAGSWEWQARQGVVSFAHTHNKSVCMAMCKF